MALETKPFFHPEVIRQHVQAFTLPERASAYQPKLQHWAELITSGRADEFKETAILPDFLTDIFCGLLGYTGPADSADTFTLSRECRVEVDGQRADAVLGRFGKNGHHFTAVIEGNLLPEERKCRNVLNIAVLAGGEAAPNAARQPRPLTRSFK